MPNGLYHGGVVEVFVGTTQLPPSMIAALARAEVQQELNLPAMCRVELGSYDFQRADWQGVDLTKLKIGDDLRIAFGMETPKVIFWGELGALEATFDDLSTVEIRGYDALYALQFGAEQRTFEGLSDTEIARRIAGEYGLDLEADDTKIKYPYVIQPAQSNFRFLAGRAARINYELFAEGKKLYFRKARSGQAADFELKWDEELTRFTVRLRALKQGSRVQRLGWDPKKKEKIVADISSGPSTLKMGGRVTGYQMSAAYAASPVSAMDPEIIDPASAREVALAAYEADLEDFIEAEASMPGDTRIKPGINILVDGIGGRLGGLYYVTAATHVYTTEEGYTTSFALRRTGV